MADTMMLMTIVAATVVATLLLAIFKEDTARQYLFHPVDQARTVIGALFITIGAWTALRSGVVWMMLLALGAIAFITLFIYFEQPHQQIR